MDFYGKIHSKKRGQWLTAAVLLLFPALMCQLLYAILMRTHRLATVAVRADAMSLGGAVGVLFHLTFVLTGGLKEARQVVRTRLRDLFENWRYAGFSAAMGWYRDDLRENGAALWLYLACFAAADAVLIFGLRLLLGR